MPVLKLKIGSKAEIFPLRHQHFRNPVTSNIELIVTIVTLRQLVFVRISFCGTNFLNLILCIWHQEQSKTINHFENLIFKICNNPSLRITPQNFFWASLLKK